MARYLDVSIAGYLCSAPNVELLGLYLGKNWAFHLYKLRQKGREDAKA